MDNRAGRFRMGGKNRVSRSATQEITSREEGQPLEFERVNKHPDLKALTEPPSAYFTSDRLNLNRKACEILGEGTGHVKVYFDRKQQVIGLRPSSKTKNTYAVRPDGLRMRIECQRVIEALYEVDLSTG